MEKSDIAHLRDGIFLDYYQSDYYVGLHSWVTRIMSGG
jgi:hypothetical protein